MKLRGQTRRAGFLAPLSWRSRVVGAAEGHRTSSAVWCVVSRGIQVVQRGSGRAMWGAPRRLTWRNSCL